MTCAPTAIGALVPRRRSRVAGEVESVVSFERPWVHTDAALVDGTGVLILRFMGRDALPGMVADSRVVAEGTPGRQRGALVMLNPIYEFESDG